MKFLSHTSARSVLIAAGLSQAVSAQQAWDPLDSDGDGVSDQWEIHYFTDLSHTAADDSDDDSVSAFLEYQNGLNPLIQKTDGTHYDWEGMPGYLRNEKWLGIPGNALADLYESEQFKESPVASLINEARVPSNATESYGTRIRGTLRAPVTGQYRFYISSNNQGELWLGTTADRFSRRRVATVVDYTNPLQWTKYSTQATALITLQAGQDYWLEALMKDGTGDDHLAIGWIRPGESAIEVVPATMPDGTVVLYSPTVPESDADDDGLPDAWESTVGLNPGDNGRINGADGGYSDWDQDGIINFEEWLSGGNPLAIGGNIGLVRRDVWTSITGGTVAALTGHANFPKNPNLSTWEQPSTLSFMSRGDSYGQKLTGCFVPPHSGNWRLWIASDDASELWVSSDASRLNKSKVAFVSANTGVNAFDTTPSQKSITSLRLVAGRPYYYEVLHKEGTGGDHASVAWAFETTNWALASQGSSATQSSTAYGGVASRAIDGNTSGAWGSNSVTHTASSSDPEENVSWLEVELLGSRPINRVVLWNRTDTNTKNRLSNFRISILNEAGTEVAGSDFFPPGTGNVDVSMTWDLPELVQGKKIRISLNGLNNAGNGFLSLAEVQAFEWYPESTRSVIPASALRSPYAEPLDLDADSLPDAWENQFGLSATDNGATLAANGEYGDPDGDGVSNLLEYKNAGLPRVRDGIQG